MVSFHEYRFVGQGHKEHKGGDTEDWLTPKFYVGAALSFYDASLRTVAILFHKLNLKFILASRSSCLCGEIF
jgi:hypothetical protein